MKANLLSFFFLLQGVMLLANGSSLQKSDDGSGKTGPEISNLTYDNITQTSVTVYWTTDSPTDSRIRWMAPDSNYQALIFTDSMYVSTLATNHLIQVNNLQAAKIYKYQVVSQNADGIAVDSGYFVTRSASTGKVNVYFNHTVDTTVSMGEHANGSQNFEYLFISRIDSAKYSIDITLWGFSYYTSIANALINAKNRGVKIRFVYNHTANTPLIDLLLAAEIPVLKREFDTTFSMHNKFWIFDYRYNDNPNTKNIYGPAPPMFLIHSFTATKTTLLSFRTKRCVLFIPGNLRKCGVRTPTCLIRQWQGLDPEKTDNVPHILNVADTRMEVYFSPSDSVSPFLSNLILTKTTENLFFCMLKFELPEIENALHTIFIDGIKIKGVFDLSNAFLPNSAYPRMKGMAVPNAWNPHADVFPDTLSGLIHHKYLIIDANSLGGNKITATGSFNWEVPATTGNDENSLTIFDARVNNLYYQEFHSRYRESGGELIGLGIENMGSEAPSGFSLFQNHPNPFNASTNIKFTVANSGEVKIVVYDMMGHQVKTLVNEMLKPGTYQSSFDGSSLPNGIYLYRYSAAGFTETRRMILEK